MQNRDKNAKYINTNMIASKVLSHVREDIHGHITEC